MSLNVVTWKWGTMFGPEYVNRLASMLKRHLHMDYRFHCITDNPDGLDAGICRHPMFTDHGEMKAGNRSCFRRLRIFDREMAAMFGPRILQLDLDMVITDDVTPLFDRPDPLVLVEQNRSGHRRVTYNPSMLLMDAGILHDMWTRFHANPNGVWQAAKSHRWNCSDMSIINDYLDQHQATPRTTWTVAEGVISYWREVKKNEGRLPAGARAVLFYGHQNPSDGPIQGKSPWIVEHWR